MKDIASATLKQYVPGVWSSEASPVNPVVRSWYKNVYSYSFRIGLHESEDDS